MHRFYVSDLKENRVIRGEDNQHLYRVLRLRSGDPIEVFDGKGNQFRAELEQTDPEGSAFRILEELPSREPKCRIVLYQGIPAKTEKMELIIQKCTEIGVHAVVPVMMERCTNRKGYDEKRLARFRKIAVEAAKQCGRAWIPEIREPVALSEVFPLVDGNFLMPYEEGGESLRKVLPREGSLSVLIGPEGGIAEQEAEEMLRRGAVRIGFGPRILRTETAGMAALSMILLLQGDMEAP
ncbi:MAG: 16S rRNA (uracil(1498)-N(3))-methyltransferase [Clostridia bacterium]|nr:16S rRNA (uracil(1498)-N(3))-methyltransferase [Clostridia bacterium]